MTSLVHIITVLKIQIFVKDFQRIAGWVLVVILDQYSYHGKMQNTYKYIVNNAQKICQSYLQRMSVFDLDSHFSTIFYFYSP